MSELTQVELKYWLDYDPAVGVFTIRVARRNTKPVGSPAGWVDDRGYTRMFLLGKLYLAHRLAWFWVYGKWPEDEIDHIDNERSNNRVANLREATALQNSYSKKPRGSSGYKGVTKAKRRGVWCGRWQAQICVSLEVKHLGYFRDPRMAAQAYDVAAAAAFGEFAKTNAGLGLL